MSIEENPSHTYHTPGTYLVRLTVYGDGGQHESNNFVTVFVSPVSYMNLAPSYVYVGDQHMVYINLSHNADIVN